MRPTQVNEFRGVEKERIDPENFETALFLCLRGKTVTWRPQVLLHSKASAKRHMKEYNFYKMNQRCFTICNRTTRMDNPHRTSYSDMLQSQYISIYYTFHLLIRYLVKLVKFTLKYEGPSLGSTLIFLERWHYLIALTQFFQILISYGFKWKIIDCTGKSYVNNTGATYQVQYIMSSNFLFLESWGFPKF